MTPDDLYVYLDAHGNRLAKGDRVCDRDTEGDDTKGVVVFFGTVVSIADPDGDMDEGRVVGISPAITVQWDAEDDGPERIPLSATARGPGDEGEYRTDELYRLAHSDVR